MQVFESKAIIVTYEAKGEYIFIVQNGFARSEEIINSRTQGLAYAQENGVERWLVDNRKAKVITQEAQDWTTDVFYAEMIKQINRFAFVLAEDRFNHHSIQRMADKTRPVSLKIGMQRKLFTDLEEAKQWLIHPEETDE